MFRSGVLIAVLAFVQCLHGSYVYEPPAKGLEFPDEDQHFQQQQQLQVKNDLIFSALDGEDGEDSHEDFHEDFNGKAGKGKRNDCAQYKCFCGTPNVNRIVGGSRVRQNKYPWTAQLVKGRWYARLFCGGTLINDRYVLTAAHCVHNNRDQITIHLLQLDRSSQSAGITRKAAQIIAHPAYDPSRIVNDIALIKLDSPVPLTVRPVCLPDANHNFDGKQAIVAGWGLVQEGGSTSSYLNEVSVPIITNELCRQTRYKSKIKPSMLCAGVVQKGGKDACQGDSGGPLIVNEGRYKLAGVVSFGYGCAQANAPGVYTRVSMYLSWIRNNTKDACSCSAA